jgi:hypothetical protein
VAAERTRGSWFQAWNLQRDLVDRCLTLAAPTNLAGVVLDEADKPVANAAVFVTAAYNEIALESGVKTFGFVAGKPVLLCLMDVEQRASRRTLRLLGEQPATLQQKSVVLLALQAAVTGAAGFKEWQDANPVAFPVGRVLEQSAKTKWATGLESMPWLILVNAQGRVVAEGFALDDLEATLKLAGH